MSDDPQLLKLLRHLAFYQRQINAELANPLSPQMRAKIRKHGTRILQ